MPCSFAVNAVDGAARAGVLTTPHGAVRTPAFMPVGTLGAVKGVPPAQLADLGAEVLLCNLYHLALRPGVDAIEALGGLHAWNGWSGPILTDSGGFQIFSLGHLRQVDDEGVTFRSHLDGAAVRLTPEEVVDLQRRLGVDVAMVLDECPPWPVSAEEATASLARTTRWAARARERWARAPGPGALFGIVQGSAFRPLRERAAGELADLQFDGYAIGGVSVGEPDAERRAAVEWTAPLLPADRPRYLMGVGYRRDIVHAVTCGIDLFDCVLPARNARHGVLFTRQGELRLKGAAFRGDPRPVEEGCPCPCCRQISRAFLHHLLRWDELTGKVLATLHNLRFYLDFMAEVRQSIAAGTLAELASHLVSQGKSQGKSQPDGDSRADPVIVSV
ncbi:MAG TPA: tRNA guanosine(34) transglycosylase Tgt [Thermoanaerobaculia bacterium]|jgi:queuine tRNA-ribosyltransferase|nr:tRNA guanosine(34) transglycosylase Tgt [Thermoanaerobaculia bacterium]